MLLLSRLTAGTSMVLADLYMFVVGLGLGFVMQVLILAVQNAVEYRDLGVATASATLFRSMGGTIGVPIFGAIFTNQLAGKLAQLPAGAAAQIPAHLGPGSISALPEATRTAYIDTYANSLHPVFELAALLALTAFAFTWWLQERPLRQTVADQNIGDSFASPRDPASLDELEERLGTLSRRENRYRIYRRVAEVAGLHLGPKATWLLLRLENQPRFTAAETAARFDLPEARIIPLLTELANEGLIQQAGEPPGTFVLSEAGIAAATTIHDARRRQLEQFLEGWQPEQQPEVLQLLERFTQSLRSKPPAGEPVPT
jgi:DNA-binding MarR family transcriptional regulator